VSLTGTVTATSGSFSGTVVTSNITATGGSVGGFTLDSIHMYYGNYYDSQFVDLSRWGLAVGPDLNTAAGNQTWHPVRMTTLADGDYGHFMAKNGNIGIASFSPDSFAIRTWPSNLFYGSGNSGSGRNTVMIIGTDGNLYISGAGYATGDWHDQTPGYQGNNATAELKLIKNDSKGNVDHSTLPDFAKHTMSVKKQNKDGKETTEKIEGRGLGAMISILTKAIQELDERLDKLEVINGKAI
jgi:hypothetical protein